MDDEGYMLRSVNLKSFIFHDILEFPAVTFIFFGMTFGDPLLPSDKKKTYGLRKYVFLMK